METATVTTPSPVSVARPHEGWLPSLDGLRAVSIVSVVLFHLRPGFLPNGSLGVEIFFFISGLLITRLLLRERARSGSIRLKAFYGRRLRRLMPALVLLVVAQGVSDLARGRMDRSYLTDSVRTLTYTTNLFMASGGRRGVFSHTWSLGVEEQFYLLWPAVLLLTLGRARMSTTRLLGCFTAVALVAHLVSYHVLPTSWVANFLPTSRFDALLCGAWVAAVLVEPGSRVSLARAVPPWLAVLCSAAVVGMFFLPAVWFRYDALCACLPFIGIVLAHVTVLDVDGRSAESVLCRLAGSSPARWLGRRSYSLYLLHLLIAGEFLFIGTTWLRLATTVAVSLLAADLSYRFVELRWIKTLRPA